LLATRRRAPRELVEDALDGDPLVSIKATELVLELVHRPL
jgi:hypothetical protein